MRHSTTLTLLDIFLLSLGLLCSGRLNTLHAAACCKSTICAPIWSSARAHPTHAATRVFLHCVLLPSLLQVGNTPLGFETKCCAPAVRCGTPKTKTREQWLTPNEKMLQYTPITKYTRYIAGGGPIKEHQQERPPYTTINVQESVTYNNPNQHCAPGTPAICCAGQPKGTHITTVLLVTAVVPPVVQPFCTRSQ